MRRRSPRPLAVALEQLGHEARPPTLLARVQAAWAEVVGPAIAAEAQPVRERDGIVTVACRSAAWASELELLAPELLERLAAALGDTAGGSPKGLRAKVGKLP
ncbi:MAG TPA: DciA family protein [Thermoleophilaceae bacterium]|nr:DciA family protein [Thermoleophilaceae bacterium]